MPAFEPGPGGIHRIREMAIPTVKVYFVSVGFYGPFFRLFKAGTSWALRWFTGFDFVSHKDGVS
jgi:hypothetical protein